MKIYISGQITGLSYGDAIDNFKAAEQEIKKYALSDKIKIINPIILCRSVRNKKWNLCMRKCIEELLVMTKKDAIYMLRNWTESRGSRIEYAVAKEMGVQIYYQE